MQFGQNKKNWIFFVKKLNHLVFRILYHPSDSDFFSLLVGSFGIYSTQRRGKNKFQSFLKSIEE